MLVLQDGTLLPEQMRGFAAPHARVPAIVLNSKDNVRARAFTLFHEVAHLFGPADMTEERADAFSAHVLMPRDAFRHSFAQSVATQLLEKIDAIPRLYGSLRQTPQQSGSVGSDWRHGTRSSPSGKRSHDACIAPGGAAITTPTSSPV